jgi:hypothetical protein
MIVSSQDMVFDVLSQKKDTFLHSDEKHTFLLLSRTSELSQNRSFAATSALVSELHTRIDLTKGKDSCLSSVCGNCQYIRV